MRWIGQTTTNTEYLGWRVVTRFLWLPKCLHGRWRWLERVQYVQIQSRYSIVDEYWRHLYFEYTWNDGNWYDLLPPNTQRFFSQHTRWSLFHVQ